MSDLVKELQYQSKILRKGGRTGLADLFDNAANEIEQLRKQIPKWISVEDGLPKQLKPTDLSDFVSVYSELDKKTVYCRL